MLEFAGLDARLCRPLLTQMIEFAEGSRDCSQSAVLATGALSGTRRPRTQTASTGFIGRISASTSHQPEVRRPSAIRLSAAAHVLIRRASTAGRQRDGPTGLH